MAPAREGLNASQEDSSGRTEAKRQDVHLDFHFLKSPQIRTIHVDGAFGGVTPKGNNICMTVYCERFPVPTQVSHALSNEGVVGEELRECRIVRNGLVRELEANLVFDIDTAKTLVSWLVEKIKRAEELSRTSGDQ